MISYRIDDRDLAAVVFGVSALSETTLSLRAVWRPQTYPHVARWRDGIRPFLDRMAGLDRELLLALVGPDCSTPDFLNPRPRTLGDTFDAELRAVSRLPAHVVDRDLDDIYPTGRPSSLRAPASVLLPRIVQTLDAYWQRCVRPWWPILHATLSADVARRGVLSSRIGIRDMVGGLSPALSLGDGEIQAWNPSGPSFEADARGHGLVLVPTHFTPHMSYPFSASAPPYLLYPVAHGGLLSLSERRTDRRPVPDQIVKLLGRSRAELLHGLEAPTSSTEVACSRGVSVSAANQQLRWLRDVGLVVGVRHGRSLMYVRTAAAEALLAGGPGDREG